jgi:hypothetical protein
MAQELLDHILTNASTKRFRCARVLRAVVKRHADADL